MLAQTHGIGVSVLCPEFVRTSVLASERNRPARYGPKQSIEPGSAAVAFFTQIAARIESGINPSLVAAKVVDAIREDQLYVFTHLGMRGAVEKRLGAIRAAIGRGRNVGAAPCRRVSDRS
jgi:hypothetical protein